MELVDRLLAILAGPNSRLASQQLMAAGHSEDEVRGAWNFARAAGYTEPTGLGRDRLTVAGKARAAENRFQRPKTNLVPGAEADKGT